MNIIYEPAIASTAPALRTVTVEADVVNSDTPDDLWNLILAEGEDIRKRYDLPMINKRPAIAGTRDAYKALGKEPNRYRPSAEALCRRLVKGMELYRINTLVDIINLISVRTGYSIGGFDADLVRGDTLTLGTGRDGEPFEGIGRGMLNIEHLPVYRDAIGGIGTPTSDNERTKLTTATRRLLMTINIYREETPADETIALTRELLEKYAGATNIAIKEFHT